VAPVEPLVRAAFRSAFPDLPATVPLTARPAPGPRSWHRVILVEGAERRVVLKVMPAPERASAHKGVMETEHRLLTELIPRISEANPSVGCPRVLAYLPEDGVLALEMIDGPPLSAILFGPARPSEPQVVRRLLERCGEWLGHLHRLTRTAERGNPFAWFRQEFEAPAVERAIRRTGAGRLHADIVAAARRLESASTADVARCTVHGIFAPYHVLVHGEGIRVIDLESAHVGYPYVDLALFDAHRAFQSPWARAETARRCPVDEQRRALLDGYQRAAGPLSALDHLALGLARVHAFVRFPRAWQIERRPRTVAKDAIRLAWWRWRLAQVWREDAPALERAAHAMPAPSS